MTFPQRFALTSVSLVFITSALVISCKDDDETPGAALTTISPAQGPKGTSLSIIGSNFGSDISEIIVTVNEKEAEVTALENAKITVTVPDKAGSGKVVVKVRGTALPSQPIFTYQLSVSTLAGNGNPGDINGAGSIAEFNLPSGIAVDTEGNVFVTDYLNCSIRKISVAGVVSSFAGKLPAGNVDGTGDAARFIGPNGTVFDAAGNLFVADEQNHSIRKITKEGVVSTFAGNGSPGYVDATGSAARFAGPSGIAIDHEGNLYVADQFNNRIRKITAAGLVTTLAGSGTPNWADGTGTAAQFFRPVGLAVDVSGNVFVGDLFNHRIRKITSAGVVTTLCGTGEPGFADGVKNVAKFRYPSGLALGPDGMLYVADSENRSIRKIDANGLVTTLAGRSEGYLDGVVDVALFRAPREIDISADGTIYVADSNDNRIRKID